MGKQRERNAIPSSDRFPHANSNDDSSKQRYAIRLAFDGTTYNGFQSQPDKNTIQDQIENRLQSLLRRPVRIVAWGRTDTGVHAKGAVVTVDLSLDEVYRFANQSGRNTVSSSISCKEEGDESVKKQTAVHATAKFLHSVLIQFACNHPLPQSRTPASQSRYGSISALAVKPVPFDFDARYSCLWKRYVYYVCATSASNEINGYTDDDQTLSPFVWNRYAWIIRQSLDLDKMMKAAELLNSIEHNYEWVVVMQDGELRDTLRKVKLCVEQVNTSCGSGGSDAPYFLQRSGNTIVYKISVESDFFLYKMVRRIVGILVAIGKSDVSLDELRVCLEEHDKRYHDEDSTTNQKKIKVPTKLLQTAPAKGLCLDHIEYEIPI